MLRQWNTHQTSLTIQPFSRESCYPDLHGSLVLTLSLLPTQVTMLSLIIGTFSDHPAPETGMPLFDNPAASKPSHGVRFEQLPSEVLLKIASLLPYSCDVSTPNYFDDVEERDSNGDFSNLMAACHRVKELVRNNAISVVKNEVSREFAIAAMLYPPIAGYHDIDDWIPKLNIKTKAVEDLIRYVKRSRCYWGRGRFVESAEALSTEQNDHKFARVGMHIYQKIADLHKDYEDQIDRYALINNLPRMALLLLRYTTFYIEELVHSQLLHKDLGLHGRVPNSEYPQAVEIRLFETDLPSIVPGLHRGFLYTSSHYPMSPATYYDPSSYFEVREIKTTSTGRPIWIWSKTSADRREYSLRDDRAIDDALHSKLNGPDGRVEDTYWMTRKKRDLQKLVEEELGDKPVEHVIAECLPFLANPGASVTPSEAFD